MSHKQIQKMVGLAIFTAVVIVLQLLGSFIKVGTFSISLVLIPIVVGAAVYGAGAGAFLGGVFGVVVTIACINGSDWGGNLLFTQSPALTILICMVKGIAAGAAAGWVYRLLAGKNAYLAVAVSALAAPVVNTGLFCLGMRFFFYDTLVAWAAGQSLVYYVFIGLIGVNFLLETLINLVCSPIILRILNAVKRVEK
ncbi:MAG: ECF transporter S component [Candidatus Faecousia sp.]|nr:ECF transporter S component [Bacillota bacterium]MDY4220101.1 ECF transporter S component [Candidatus Faecousia sp.]